MSKAGREKFKRVADGSVGSGHPTCTDGEDAAEEFERKYGSFRSQYGGSQLYRKYDDGYSSCEDDNLDPPPFLRNITVSISRSVNLSSLSDFFNILELISNMYLFILIFDWAE